jgi:WD40 repeat protein
MHTGTISATATDANGQIMVTAGKGKTIRLWDLQSGQLIKVFRPPIGEGQEGEIYAVALSPNGQQIAAGGYTGYTWDQFFSVYIFNRFTGQLVKPQIPFPRVITSLAFSPDGKFLVIGMAERGLRIYRTDTWTLAGKDEEYYGTVTSLAWTLERRLISTTYNYVFLYDSLEGFPPPKIRNKLSALATTSCARGTNPISVSVAPTHGSIAVGFEDSMQVVVLRSDNLDLQFCAKTPGLPQGKNLQHVAWSGDGENLFAGGTYKSSENVPAILGWNSKGRGVPKPYVLEPHSSVTSLAPYPKSGGLLFASDPPALGGIDDFGRLNLIKPTRILNFNGWNLAVSSDGEIIELVHAASSKSPIRFSLTKRELTSPVAPDPRLRRSNLGGTHLRIELGNSTTPPSLSGKYLALGPEEGFSSWTLDPHGKGFVLGSQKYLRLFDKEGNSKWPVPVPGTFWSVHVADSRQVIVAALGDGTIRWYRVQDGQELLALFIHADLERWILWTSSGYYEASPGGDDFVGWHVNQGSDKVAEFFPVSRFRATYNRPDIVDRILSKLDEGESIRLANKEADRRPQELRLMQQLPPVVTILDPKEGEVISTKEITVRYTIRTPSNEPITGITALLDGRLVDMQMDSSAIGKTWTEETIHALQVRLSERMLAREFILALRIHNRYATSEPALVRLRWQGPVLSYEPLPTLYVLAVGVTNYKEIAKLPLSVSDADAFLKAMVGQTSKPGKPGLYHVVVPELIPDPPKKETIQEGFRRLLATASENDVVMIFLEGHGYTEPSTLEYFFLPTGFERNTVSTGLSLDEIKNAVKRLKATTYILVDSCYAGVSQVFVNEMINQLRDIPDGTSPIVVTSSTGLQSSTQDPGLGYSTFTKALLEGLAGFVPDWPQGQINQWPDGPITLQMLYDHLHNRVMFLSKKQQKPTVTLPKAAGGERSPIWQHKMAVKQRPSA